MLTTVRLSPLLRSLRSIASLAATKPPSSVSKRLKMALTASFSDCSIASSMSVSSSSSAVCPATPNRFR